MSVDRTERDAPPVVDVAEAWAREIERRIDEYRAGRVKTLSWQRVRAHLHRNDR